MSKPIVEGIDFYYEDGYMVLTEKYHLDKGFCCGNGCRHCPFNYESVPEPKRSELMVKKDLSSLRGVAKNEAKQSD